MGKFIQYFCRLATYLTQTEGHPTQLHKAFKALFESMSTSRKLFRLFKFMNDYIKIRDMLQQKSTDLLVNINKGIQISIRAIFFLYWVIDNYLILNKILLGKSGLTKGTSTTKFWIYGSLLSIMLGILEITAGLREKA